MLISEVRDIFVEMASLQQMDDVFRALRPASSHWRFLESVGQEFRRIGATYETMLRGNWPSQRAWFNLLDGRISLLPTVDDAEVSASDRSKQGPELLEDAESVSLSLRVAPVVGPGLKLSPTRWGTWEPK